MFLFWKKKRHIIIGGIVFPKSVEEKLSLAQEDLISNRNQIGNQSKLIQELKTAKATLEQDAAKKEQQLQEQFKVLQDIKKEKVFHFPTHLQSWSCSGHMGHLVTPLPLIQVSPSFSMGLSGGLPVFQKTLLGTGISVLGSTS